MILVANRNLPESGLLHIKKDDGTIVETDSDQCVSIIVYEKGPEGLVCPECTKTAIRFEELFRTARVGAPFYLAGVLPTLLEFAPDGDQPADRTYRGRSSSLLPIVDREPLGLQHGCSKTGNRTKTRGLIYHNVLAHPQASSAVEEQIRELEKMQNSSAPIRDLFRRATSILQQSSAVPFRKLQLALQQGGVESKQFNHNTRILEGFVWWFAGGQNISRSHAAAGDGASTETAEQPRLWGLSPSVTRHC